MKIKGAIFDLDGTVLDTMSIWEALGEKYLRAKGIEPEKDLRRKMSVMSLIGAAEYFREHYHVTDNVEKIVSDVVKEVKDFYENIAEVKAGMPEFLASLDTKNIRMCIATATDRELAESALKRCGIDGYFGKIFTCGELGTGKDKPDIYNIALQYLGTERENTAVFEDAYHAAQTAKNAGFKLCGVFDKFEQDTEKVKNISDLYFESLSGADKFFD